MKFYDKEIEKSKTSIIETITILVVFLVSFLFGYVVGMEERMEKVEWNSINNEQAIND